MREKFKKTISFCPICYKEIPAVVHVNDNVWMMKNCDMHGDFTAMVERDPLWYFACQELDCKNIYDGYLIDVTDRCNISCKYCYHKKEGTDTDKDYRDIIIDGLENINLAPIILTGGEPTIHPDLPLIVKALSAKSEVTVLSNGIKLCDEEYLDKLCRAGLKRGNVLYVGLSFHKESNGKDIKFLELCRKKGLIVVTTFYVIDELSQIEDAIAIYKGFPDVIGNMRIKAASNLWNENKSTNKIFVSDMIGYLRNRGATDLITGQYNNKVSFANVFHDGMILLLISWYDVNNVDLEDINCAPFYKANNGGIYNLVTSCLINEGVEKHCRVTVRRARACDIPAISDMWALIVIGEDKNANPDKNMYCEQAARLMQTDLYHLYVAERNGEIIGFNDGIFSTDPANGEIYIAGRHFYVKPEHRGSGAGKLLHKNSLDIGRSLGAKLIRRNIREDKLPSLLAKGHLLKEYIVDEYIKEVTI